MHVAQGRVFRRRCSAWLENKIKAVSCGGLFFASCPIHWHVGYYFVRLSLFLPASVENINSDWDGPKRCNMTNDKETDMNKHTLYSRLGTGLLPSGSPLRGLCLGCMIALSATSLPLQANTTPTINLFPSSVVENLRTSANSAQTLEEGMHPIVKQMEEQLALYQESRCGAGDADQGCTAIREILGATYTAMLEQMESHLPSIRIAMESTKKSVGGRLRKELGHKMTPRDLQRLLSGDNRSGKRIRQRAGKRKGRISSMLSKYSSLVAMAPNQGQPMATLAADIYLDAMDTVDQIGKLEMNITQSKTAIALGSLYYGEPSEAMVATVGRVKALLFGEMDEMPIPSDNIQGQAAGGFDDTALLIR